MICPNCNKEIQSGLAFCPHCGTPIPQQPYSYYGAPQNNNKNKNGLLIGLCIALGILLLLVIGIGGWLVYSHNEEEKEKIAQELAVKKKELEEAQEKTPDTVIVEKTKKVKEVVSVEHQEPINPTSVRIKGNAVNVRYSPSLSSDVMGLVYKGESFGFISDLGEWYEIDYYGSYGYVRKHHTNGKRIAVAR